MTEKEIRSLSRHDLLILLAEQTERVDRLTEQLKEKDSEIKKLQELKNQLQQKDDEIKQLQTAMEALKNRPMMLEECGTLAEAALKLTDIFINADKAAEQYVMNVKYLSDRQEALCKKREDECMQRCNEMLRQAEEQAAYEIAKIDEHWNKMQNRYRKKDDDLILLRGILDD